MATTHDSPQFVTQAGAYEVTSHNVGKSVVNVIQNLFASGKKRRGDYYLDRTYPLIQLNFEMFEPSEQDTIHFELERVTRLKTELDNANDSISRSHAKYYKRVTKHLFHIVDSASRRIASNSLRTQMSEAMDRRAARPPPPPTGTTSPPGHSHEAPSLVDRSASNLTQVAMTVLQPEATGEPAVFLQLHGRDGTTQGVVGTFLRPGVPDGRRNEGVETATLSSLGSNGAFGPPEASGHVGQ